MKIATSSLAILLALASFSYAEECGPEDRNRVTHGHTDGARSVSTGEPFVRLRGAGGVTIIHRNPPPGHVAAPLTVDTYCDEEEAAAIRQELEHNFVYGGDGSNTHTMPQWLLDR